MALRFDSEDPIWPNRDRFVLSNGHASMLLKVMRWMRSRTGSGHPHPNIRTLSLLFAAPRLSVRMFGSGWQETRKRILELRRLVTMPRRKRGDEVVSPRRRPRLQSPSGQYSAGMACIALGESASGVLAASALAPQPGAPPLLAPAASAQSAGARDWPVSPGFARTVGLLISKPIEFICALTASGSSAHDE